jgi:hypothetical protein
MAKPPVHQTDQQQSSLAGVAVVMLIAVVVAYSCGKEDGSSSSSQPLSTAYETSQPAPTPTPTARAPQVAGAAVLQAAMDAERAIGAFSASGARLYSENCYAFLTARYSDATRDRCLAFDLLSAKVTSERGDTSELEWFDEAAIRARFADASGLKGQAPEAAQLHFASVASLTQTMSVTPVAPPEPGQELAETSSDSPLLAGFAAATTETNTTAAMDEGDMLTDLSEGPDSTLSDDEAEIVDDELTAP